MNESMTLGRRMFSAAIASLTILATAGFAAFAVPQTAGAASDEGDLIKGSLSAVYYHAYDGMRYAFPNDKVFNTWYNDFDDVETLDDSDIADITLGGNVVYRPGSTWVKITTDPKTYAVSTDMTLRWIESEAVASDFAGDDWNTNIVDVSDVFFADYTVGTSLMTAEAFDGMTYMDGGNYYLAWDGEKRMLTDDGREDNMFDDSAFLDGAGIDDSALTMGDDIDSQVCALVDAAQQDCEGMAMVAGGDVEVSVATSSPDGTTIPKGVTSLEVAAFDFEAGDEDAEVDELVFRMFSLGSTTNVSNVYLYEGNTRLTDSRSVNASTREVTFGSLNLEIEAGDTRTFSVRVEVSTSATTGDLVGFELQDEDSVTVEGGDVDGSFPVRADEHEISGTSVGTLTVTKSGTITNPSLGGGMQEIGEFKVAVATEDASIEAMTLKVDNAADHSDFVLLDGAVELAEGEYIGDKLVLFELDEAFEIEEGSSNVFTVEATIGGDSSDAIKVYFDNKNDLTATGGDYGFNMNVDIGSSGTYDGSSCTSSSGNCSYSTIEGGDIVITNEGPSAGEISVNADAQNLLEFTITTAADVTFKDLDIIVYADDDGDNDALDAVDDDAGNATGDADGLVGTSTGNISNIRLVNAETGSTVMGPLELDSVVAGGDDADQTIDFTDDFEMEAGESLTLQVLVDTESGLTSGTELAAAVDVSGLVIEDANGDSITVADSVTPSTDVNGKNQEALSASLEVTLGTSGDKTHVQGSSSELMNTFNLKAGDGGDVTISSVELSIYSHDAATGTFDLGDCDAECAGTIDVNTYITSCTIQDADGVQVGTATSPTSNGQTVTIDDIEWVVEAGATDQINVYCSFQSSVGGSAVYFAVDIADLSEDIIAEDAQSVDVDPTTDAPNSAPADPLNVVTLATSGSLAFELDSSTPDADFIVTGSAWTLVSSYDATATNEDFEVEEVTFREYAAARLGESSTSAYTASVSKVKLTYPTADGAGGEAEAFTVGDSVEFSSLDAYVEFGASSSLFNVYVMTNDTARVDGTAVSNHRLQFVLSGDTTADDEFRANGAGSDAQLDDDDVAYLLDTDNDTTGITLPGSFVVKETYPTVALAATSPSGAAVPSDLEVLEFNVTAHANEAVVIDEMIFTMSATDNSASPTKWINCDGDANDVQASSFDFYQNTGSLTKLDASDSEWTLLAADGDTCDVTADTGAGEPVKFVLLDLATPEVVPAGTTATYELHFNAAGAAADVDDSIQFGLAEDPIVAVTSFLAAGELAGAEAVTETVLTMDAGDGDLYTPGDIACFDDDDDGCDATDELMLVVAAGGTDITVVRGYLGTAPVAAGVADDDIDRVSGAFFWQDDGTNGSSATGEYWGSYLVDGLELTGNALTF